MLSRIPTVLQGSLQTFPPPWNLPFPLLRIHPSLLCPTLTAPFLSLYRATNTVDSPHGPVSGGPPISFTRAHYIGDQDRKGN